MSRWLAWMVVLCLLSPLGSLRAANYTWTNNTADASGYWTNGVLWGNASPAVFPGSAVGDSAFLTNQFSGSATNLLNFSPVNAISTLAISNNLGEMWLVITNGAAAPTVLNTSSALVLGNGARLQIDNGGVVTQATAATFTWRGANGVILLNNGGKLFTAGAITIGSSGANITDTVTTVSSAGGTWNVNNQTFGITSNFTTLTLNNVTLTNVGAMSIGSAARNIANSLTISNGALVFGGSATIGAAAGAASNAYNVGGLGGVSTVSHSGAVNVGTAGGGFNSILVTNANLTTGGAVTVGTGSSNNIATVMAGGFWNGGGQALTIGSGAAASNLFVVNGGVVSNFTALSLFGAGTGVIGNGLIITNGGQFISSAQANISSSSGRGNFVLVTGAGSVWTNATTIVFNGGTGGNNLTVANGGAVFANVLDVGGASPSNTVTVTDPGSVLRTTSAGEIGEGAADPVSRLIITNGGLVVTPGMLIANTALSGGGYSNQVIVTGSGSTWSNNGVLVLGNNGPGTNLITVNNGGLLYVNSSPVVGRVGFGNGVTVTDSGSVWTNTGGLTIGAGGSQSSLLISNGGTVFATSGVIGNTGTNNLVVITGGGSSWQLTGGGSLTLGSGAGGSFNQLVLTNNGKLVSGAVTIGGAAGANGNSVSVNNGALWDMNNNILIVGTGGSFSNALNVNPGGTVLANVLTISANAADRSNQVNVSGGNLFVTNVAGNANLAVGGLGSGLVTVTNGGLAVADQLSLGLVAGSAGTLTVVNQGTFVLTNSALMLGVGGGAGVNLNNGGVLVVTNTTLVVGQTSTASLTLNGGVLSNPVTGTANALTAMTLGQSAGANGTFNMYGGNFFVTNAAGNAQLIVGQNGAGTLTLSNGTLTVNQLLLTNNFGSTVNSAFNFNGGTLVTSNAANSVAYNQTMASSFNYNINGNWTMLGGTNLYTLLGSAGTLNLGNRALVTVANGAVWNLGANNLNMGNGTPNTGLIITNGGQVIGNGSINMGLQNGASNNYIVVTGAGSLLSNTTVIVGVGTNPYFFTSESNSLTVSQGGRVVVTGTLYTGSAGAGHGWITITDTNSSLTAKDLFVNGGSFVTFLVSNGASYTVTDGITGSNGGSNISYIVTGAGSVMRTGGFNIGIGAAGGCSLLVSKGGLVVDPAAFIGLNGGLTFSNSVLVTDPGSIWSNSVSLAIAGNTVGTTITAANGGYIYNGGSLTVFGNRSNAVVVTGAGSIFTNGANTILTGNYNSLSILNGGVFFTTGLSIGCGTGGNGNALGVIVSTGTNIVTVAGAGSALRINGGSITIGGLAGTGNGNQILVTGGGLITSAGGVIGLNDGVTGTNFQYTTPGGAILVLASNGGVSTSIAGDSNLFLVADAGSLWNSIGGTLTVGNAGHYNMLVVSNGGAVVSDNSVIGNSSSYVTNVLTFLSGGAIPTTTITTVTVTLTNTYASALVTGSGSVWSNLANLVVGNTGAGNALTVSDSGFVLASNLIVGASASSTGNLVTVNGGVLQVKGSATIGQSGSGTLLVTNANFTVGQLTLGQNAGGAGTLTINGGGLVAVTNSLFVLGQAAGSFGTLNLNPNSVLALTNGMVTAGVSGTGSINLNGGSFSNLLTGANSLDGLVLGQNATGTGNFNMASGAFYVTNATATAQTVVGQNGLGRLLLNGGTFSVNQLLVTNNTATATNSFLSINSGATLITTNGVGQLASSVILVSNANFAINGTWNMLGGLNQVGTTAGNGQAGIISIGNGVSNASVLVDANATWNLGSVGLVIGNLGNNNQLVVTNGGLVISPNATIGLNGNNNLAFVSGAGSTWNIGGALNIGSAAGTSNLLVVADGGVVTNGSGSLTGNNNAALVTGSGAQWSAGSFGVGLNGSFNTVTVSNGGLWQTTGAIVGANLGDNSNTVVVTGAGSSWQDNGTVLALGASGYANTVIVTNGGSLTTSGALRLGTSGGGNNGLWVGGSGSAVASSGGLDVGASSGAQGNGLRIDNGGVVSDTMGSIGNAVDASGNWVLVTGNGSTWNNSSGLTIGGAGISNQLTVSKGGRVTTTIASIGTSGSNNTVLLTDLGSQLRLTGGLTLGSALAGSGNSLTVTNAAGLVGTSTILGGAAGANDNAVLVTGTGSTWTNSGTLTIGTTNATGNQVIVNNGARFQGGVTTLGFGLGANNNSLTVNVGTFTSGALTIGLNGGANNSLTASNASLVTGALIVGSSASNNTVNVIGSGWSLGNGALMVGSGYSSGNTLTLNGSVLSNVGTVFVGANTNATFNSLVISNGSVFSATALRMGQFVGNNNNSALIVDGSELDVNQLIVFPGTSGNTISNRNSTFQFTLASPVIQPNGGIVAMTDGTISFRAINNADVTNNLGKGALSGITFAGANTFRLNAASNTVAGQTYTFGTSGGPSNYVNLVMVNGATAYRGGDLTIGSTGTMLVSNTTATVTGLFTNQGLTRIAGANAAFLNGVINAGTLSLQQGTIIGALNNLASGTWNGSGLVQGDVSNLGTISPGFSAGTLSITGSLNLVSSGTLVMELFAVGSNDLLNVSGLLTYGGTLVVSNATGFGYTLGESWKLWNAGSWSGDFGVTNLPDLSLYGMKWDTSQLDTAGVITTVLIPEPSTVALLMGGLALLVVTGRRRRIGQR